MWLKAQEYSVGYISSIKIELKYVILFLSRDFKIKQMLPFPKIKYNLALEKTSLSFIIFCPLIVCTENKSQENSR